MKCPFELPVKANVSTVDSDRRYITGTKGFPYICGDMLKEYADYIVQAINSHEKLKTVSHNLAKTMGIDYAIRTLSASEDTMAVGAAVILKGIQSQAKQALKEAEKQ